MKDTKDYLPKIDSNDLKPKKLRSADDDISLQREARRQARKKLAQAKSSKKPNTSKPTAKNKLKKETTKTPNKPKTTTPKKETTKTPKPTTPSISSKRLNDLKGNKISDLKQVTKLSRYEAFIEKVNKITDIKVLKKMIYNRNYNIKKNYIKENPEVENLKYLVINDMRHVKKTSLERIANIKDPEKQIQALRSVLIDNTRRKNKPILAADYSIKEQDYMGNAIYSLMQAINSWADDNLREKMKAGVDLLTLDDIREIFKVVPSYWAISEGYYYAIEDFSSFIDELLDIVTRKSNNKITLEEKMAIADNLFKNNPQAIE